MSNSIGGGSALNNIQNNPLYDDRTVARRDQPTGSGVNGGSGQVPGANAGTGQSGGASQNAKMSLSVFMSNGPAMDTDVLLVQVAVSMRDSEATSQKAKINTDQETKKAQSKEKEAKLEEAQKKMDEAEAKKKSGNLIDKIKLAFEWLGAVLAVAMAAILIATGVGTAVGVALIGAAIIAVTMAIDSTVTLATGKGIAGNAQYAVSKAQGKSDEEANKDAAKADMGFKISMAVLGIAFAIASGGSSMVNGVKNIAQAGMAAGRAGAQAAEAGGVAAKTVKDVAMAVKDAVRGVMGAAKEAEALAETGAKVSKGAQALANLTGKSTEEVMQGLKMAKTVTTITESTQQAAAAGVEGASIGYKYQATESSADAKKLEASAKVDEAIMQMLDDMIDAALTRLMASGDRFAAMLDGISEAMQDRGNTMSRARFGG